VETTEVYTTAAAFYVVLIKAGYYDEAAEFVEWFLDTFDLDLERGRAGRAAADAGYYDEAADDTFDLDLET
jgi:hypothetical protein